MYLYLSCFLSFLKIFLVKHAPVPSKSLLLFSEDASIVTRAHINTSPVTSESTLVHVHHYRGIVVPTFSFIL